MGWPGPGITPDDEIPEADPSDSSPTAGLLSDQVFRLLKAAAKRMYTGVDNNLILIIHL